MSAHPNAIRVAVTGAAGKLAYALLFRIASGSMFGKNQPVELHLIEIPERQEVLKGVVMELEDCAFPLLKNIVVTSSLEEGFRNVNWVFLIGSVSQSEGMSRAEYIAANGKIFWDQARVIQDHAAFDVRILVIGNPCNTNCWAATQNARDIPPNRWFTLTRLDEGRAKLQLAKKAGVHPTQVSHLAVWGNHANILYPDFLNARIGKRPAAEVIADNQWLENTFLKTVQQRRAEIIQFRGGPPTASAAHAVVETVKFLTASTPTEDWFSIAVPSDGSYDIEKGLVCSFPIERTGSDWEIVPNIRLNDFSRAKIKAAVNDLIKERDIVKKALGIKNSK